MQHDGRALQYASYWLKNDKKIVLAAVIDSSLACCHSLLKGYQTFGEIVEKELKKTFCFLVGIIGITK